MNLNFEFFLTLVVIITGVITLADLLIFAPRRKRKKITHPSIVIEYARSFFPVLFFVLLIRSFLAEPFRIPSGSEKPDLLIGDFIVANKFIYGIRLPVTHKKMISVSEPKRGDIIVFLWPKDTSTYFIKRVIGVPGDVITYKNKVLTINGQQASQQLLGETMDSDGRHEKWPVLLKRENLLGIQHDIYLRPDQFATDFSVVVPQGNYFVMGDNRDNSLDSRYWGFVPEKDLIGKAMWVFFSWDNEHHRVRWDRLGLRIH
ncbi:signal peptidase I [Rickettsiella grylli]|uniref:Signal peptidase I n=1 Tax=Rickettsiella grylli TaxID=59196 RepID=A8PN32_9COXI|nr:signal peptidase I [Rickettsiella grylli]EDP46498.1 signal peptidase I [Rickettsiella grylli]